MVTASNTVNGNGLIQSSLGAPQNDQRNPMTDRHVGTKHGRTALMIGMLLLLLLLLIQCVNHIFRNGIIVLHGIIGRRRRCCLRLLLMMIVIAIGQ